MKKRMYIHSGCHGKHWELSWTKEGGYELACEICGKLVGYGIQVTGPALTGKECECAKCKAQRAKQN